jgi:hypothetical protein
LNLQQQRRLGLLQPWTVLPPVLQLIQQQQYRQLQQQRCQLQLPAAAPQGCGQGPLPGVVLMVQGPCQPCSAELPRQQQAVRSPLQMEDAGLALLAVLRMTLWGSACRRCAGPAKH